MYFPFLSFFKRKTAYELRIRDWGSDVFSSDHLLTLAMQPSPSSRDYRGAVRFRLPVRQADGSEEPVIPSLQIDTLADPAMAPALAAMVRGRHVLIGGDLVDLAQFATPLSGRTARSTMIGLEVHATMLAPLLAGARPDAGADGGRRRGRKRGG